MNRLKNQSIGKLAIILYNIIRMTLINLLHMGKVHASLVQNINPTAKILCGGGEMVLSHSIFTRRNVTLSVSRDGKLTIGSCFFNQGCNVTCLKRIDIGDNCLFGPNVVIVDHDHDYNYLSTKRGSEYICKEIHIGKNVVVGANTVILKGTTIGDNCMIGAGSVVSGFVPENTLYFTQHEKIMKEILFN